MENVGLNGIRLVYLALAVPTLRGVKAMEQNGKTWLDEYAVTCRVFKGRWSIRHCVRMYHDIQDLKIRMSSRAHGVVTRYESSYNPCERCKVLKDYRAHLPAEHASTRDESFSEERWAM